MLDTKHRMLRAHRVHRMPRQHRRPPARGLSRSVTASAAAIVLFHNHPSGDPAPVPTTWRSPRGWSRRIHHRHRRLDHVILADQRYFSFAESGQLPPGIAVRAAADLAERAG
jgi:DNA repair protein RadC